MKVKYQLNKEVGGVQVPLFLQEQNATVTVLMRDDLNFDKYTLRGRGLVQKRFMSNLAKKEGVENIVVNVSELNQIKDDISRVKYLESRGILLKVEGNSIDFSPIRGKEVEEEDEEKPKKVVDDEISSIIGRIRLLRKGTKQQRRR